MGRPGVMDILRPGAVDPTQWSGRLECNACGMQARVKAQDLHSAHPGAPRTEASFYVECPTPGCGVYITIAPMAVPRAVIDLVERRLATIRGEPKGGRKLTRP